MASASLSGLEIWVVYFLVYSAISLTVILLFNQFNSNSIGSANLFLSNKLTKIFMVFRLLSLGGMPPFTGVLPKILVLARIS